MPLAAETENLRHGSTLTANAPVERIQKKNCKLSVLKTLNLQFFFVICHLFSLQLKVSHTAHIGLAGADVSLEGSRLRHEAVGLG